jgi:hypothetical protein
MLRSIRANTFNRRNRRGHIVQAAEYNFLIAVCLLRSVDWVGTGTWLRVQFRPPWLARAVKGLAARINALFSRRCADAPGPVGASASEAELGRTGLGCVVVPGCCCSDLGWCQHPRRHPPAPRPALPGMRGRPPPPRLPPGSVSYRAPSARM